MPVITAAKPAAKAIPKERPRLATEPQPIISVYFQGSRLSGIRFIFTVGYTQNQEEGLPVYALNPFEPSELLTSKPVPWIWEGEINRYLAESSKDGCTPMPLGHMVFSEITVRDKKGTKRIAFTESYYPRNDMGRGVARKMPYFMEAIAANHLRTLGFTHLSPGFISQKREDQLNLVGLVRGEMPPIERWLKRMGYGIRMSQDPDFRRL